MPPRAEFFSRDPRLLQDDGGPAPFGARWGLGLGGALLLLFSATVAAHWLGSDTSRQRESIVQQGISPEVSSAATAPRSEVTAPDPGDN